MTIPKRIGFVLLHENEFVTTHYVIKRSGEIETTSLPESTHASHAVDALVFDVTAEQLITMARLEHELVELVRVGERGVGVSYSDQVCLYATSMEGSPYGR